MFLTVLKLLLTAVAATPSQAIDVQEIEAPQHGMLGY